MIEESNESKHTHKDAKKIFYSSKIYSKPLKHEKKLLKFSISRFELLNYCIPITPLFALRTFSQPLSSPRKNNSLLIFEVSIVLPPGAD